MEYGELMEDILALILKRVVLRTAESHLPVLAVKTCTSISVLAKVKIGKNQSTNLYLMSTEYQTVNNFVNTRM